MLLIWHWDKPLDPLQQLTGPNIPTGGGTLKLEYPKSISEKATRLYNVASVLKDAEKYESATEYHENC
jgi:hypothetical protein